MCANHVRAVRGKLLPSQIAASEAVKSSVYILLKMSFNCVVFLKLLSSEDTKIFPVLSFLCIYSLEGKMCS